MSRQHHGNKRWEDYLSSYSLSVLSAAAGVSGGRYAVRSWIEDNRKNPIAFALQSDPVAFVNIATEYGKGTKAENKSPNLSGLSEACVLCQMILYDYTGGPDGDWREKGLRRHWYAYYKQFAQMLAFATGRTRQNAQGLVEMIDVQWSGRMSQTYAGLVDTGSVTYRDLWVEDQSRMTEVFGTYGQLIPGFNLILAVEKDSLFADYREPAKAAGAIALISGKGKNSKAATELMLRQTGLIDNGEAHSARVAVLSDYDFDGHAVIQPTFAEQMRRYVPLVEEARIGVLPEQVLASKEGDDAKVWDASYQVKQSNQGYIDWAEKNAIYWALCRSCGREQFTVGLPGNAECARCNAYDLELTDTDEAHGFEVESLQTRDYYRAIVQAVLSFIEWDDLLVQLRNITQPNRDSIASQIADQMLEENERYTKINKALEYLQEQADTLRRDMRDMAAEKADTVISDEEDTWWQIGDDPDVEDFEDHVVSAGTRGWGNVWRPYSVEARNAFVIDNIKEDYDFLDELREVDFDDFDSIVREVKDILE